MTAVPALVGLVGLADLVAIALPERWRRNCRATTDPGGVIVTSSSDEAGLAAAAATARSTASARRAVPDIPDIPEEPCVHEIESACSGLSLIKLRFQPAFSQPCSIASSFSSLNCEQPTTCTPPVHQLEPQREPRPSAHQLKLNAKSTCYSISRCFISSMGMWATFIFCS